MWPYTAAALLCPVLTHKLDSTLRIFLPDEVLFDGICTFTRNGVSTAYVCGENYSLQLPDKRSDKTVSPIKRTHGIYS